MGGRRGGSVDAYMRSLCPEKTSKKAATQRTVAAISCGATVRKQSRRRGAEAESRPTRTVKAKGAQLRSRPASETAAGPPVRPLYRDAIGVTRRAAAAVRRRSQARTSAVESG